MLKIGLDIEHFLVDKNNNIVCPSDYGITDHDACGFLAELRAKPFEDIEHSFYDLSLKYKKLSPILEEKGLKIDPRSKIKLPIKFLFKVGRSFGKDRQKDDCMYGEVKHHTYQTAGLHIHFSGEVFELNIPKIILFLDNRFKKEILAEGRQLGLYEMKHYGFEYRSLPGNIDLDKVKTALKLLSLK